MKAGAWCPQKDMSSTTGAGTASQTRLRGASWKGNGQSNTSTALCTNNGIKRGRQSAGLFIAINDMGVDKALVAYLLLLLLFFASQK